MRFAVGTMRELDVISKVIAVHDTAWPNSTGIVDLLRCSTDCFVITDGDDEVVGYAFTERDELRGHSELQDIAVSLRHRGQGLGKRLLRAVLKSNRRVKLVANADDPAVIGFYERMGFAREAVIENYYAVGHDGLRMSWDRDAVRRKETRSSKRPRR